jgi:hypothetical protein
MTLSFGGESYQIGKPQRHYEDARVELVIHIKGVSRTCPAAKTVVRQQDSNKRITDLQSAAAR